MIDRPSRGKNSAWFDFFFVRPVPAVIWIMLIILIGFTAYNSLTKESLPDLEIPEASIITEWPGATPDMIEKRITQPLENTLRGVKGVKSIHSSSYDEMSIVAVRFRVECGLGESMQLLNRKVLQAQALLPPEAKRSRVEETSVRDLPIASFALSGRVEQSTLQDLAKKLKRRLQKIPGIKKTVIYGAREQVVKVQLHPARMRELGVPASLVRQRIMAHNYDSPWGAFENQQLSFRLKMSGTYRELDDLRSLPIERLPQGRLIRLSDLAEVKQGFMGRKTQVSLSWQGRPFNPVLTIEVLKAAGKDTIKLVKAAKKAVFEMRDSAAWPPGVSCTLVGNDGRVIQEELERGFNNGWQAMLAVFLVLLFMLTWREALVAAVLVPLTLMASLVVLWALGYSFNLLVMVGMILALGLLVDDFILILEGMHEGIYLKGLGLVESIKYTLSSFAVPSLSGSITTILVLLPLAFVGGVDGKFIRLIPLTAAICLTISYLISILLGPPLARLAFRNREKAHGPGYMDRLTQRAGAGLSAWLQKRVLRSRRTATGWIVCAVGLFIMSLGLFSLMNDTLYPKEDGRELGILVELSPESKLSYSAKVAEKIGDILRAKPYFQYVTMVVGQRPSFCISSFHDLMAPQTASNLIGFNCMLKPRKNRDRLGHEYVEPLRRELKSALVKEPGVRLFFSPKTGGASGEDPLQIDIQGEDMKRLRKIALAVKRRLARVPGVVDVRDNLGPARTELRLKPLRESLDFHQVEQEELARQLIAFMEHEKVGDFYRPGSLDNLPIRLGAWWPSQKGVMAKGPCNWIELEKLFVINAQGKAVSLWNLTRPVMEQTSGVITHKNAERSVTVMAKLNDVYVSEVIRQMMPVLDEMQKDWPQGYSYEFAGEKEVSQEVYQTMFKMFVIALVLLYAILALLFDSLAQPVIILSTVIFALTGVFAGFFISGLPFSFSAAIGIVALTGIVVNDAIVIITTMNRQLASGHGLIRAALNGASERLRPIVSTTVTNLAGLTPLALSDPGWSPLCLAIIFGEIAATVGALVLVPALYVAITPKGKAY
ncbi:efflux RND transporter permease subunit [Dethiosulfatarculus sandiegensis]|uniref:Acriflavin resistance protein n=1 Tax=Dethiosulfatarculus sandiegensis TaxID=1429043 RepID=A0A0D2GGL6_9BACT|nr:efflux RND transporter permease subunit [Dethiosulfatarculus sandiegensis]KIX14022.1 hypothetical protein X474_10820 [Dethiosulfatarculus sandiegensis]